RHDVRNVGDHHEVVVTERPVDALDAPADGAHERGDRLDARAAALAQNAGDPALGVRRADQVLGHGSSRAGVGHTVLLRSPPVNQSLIPRQWAGLWLRGATTPPMTGRSRQGWDVTADATTLPSPCLVILVGAGASGKSTWAAAYAPPGTVVGSDAMRAL